MTDTDQAGARGLISAYQLDGKGGGTRLDWTSLHESILMDGVRWIHLDFKDPYTTTFVREHSSLETAAADVLLAEHTRPRLVHFDDGVLVILRGINFNPGAEPDDLNNDPSPRILFVNR